MNTRISLRGRKQQSGVMLLEALIGILIFSLGILAMVGMQSVAVQLSTDARDRAEANNLASQLVGEMWVSNRADLVTNFAYGGGGTAPGGLTNWISLVEERLPDAAAYPPVVSIAPSALGASVGTETMITLRWKNPTDDTIHQFVLTAYIN